MREHAKFGNHKIFQYGSADSMLDAEAQWKFERNKGGEGLFLSYKKFRFYSVGMKDH